MTSADFEVSKDESRNEKMKKGRQGKKGKGKGRAKGKAYVKIGEENEKAADALNGESDIRVEKKPLVVDGVCRVPVAARRPRHYYARYCRLIFAGYTGKGGEWTHGKVEQVELVAFGGAIGEAVMVADELLRSNVATIDKMDLGYSSLTNDRDSPRTVIIATLRKDWVPDDDEILKKSSVWKRIHEAPLKKAVDPLEASVAA